MRSPFYQALFDTRPSSEAMSEYETTAGGYRLSASIAGGITGRGADIIIANINRSTVLQFSRFSD
jgi:hypothetical protein